MVGEVRMVDPNAIIIFDLDSVEIIQQHALHEFDLRQFKEDHLEIVGSWMWKNGPCSNLVALFETKTQTPKGERQALKKRRTFHGRCGHKEGKGCTILQDTQDFQAAFANAVQKRVQYAIHPMFIGLSSGYDSGAIHVALVQDRTDSAHHFCFRKSSSCNFLCCVAKSCQVHLVTCWAAHSAVVLLPTDPILLGQMHSREANLLLQDWAFCIHRALDWRHGDIKTTDWLGGQLDRDERYCAMALFYQLLARGLLEGRSVAKHLKSFLRTHTNKPGHVHYIHLGFSHDPSKPCHQLPPRSEVTRVIPSFLK